MCYVCDYYVNSQNTTHISMSFRPLALQSQTQWHNDQRSHQVNKSNTINEPYDKDQNQSIYKQSKHHNSLFIYLSIKYGQLGMSCSSFT